MAMINAEVYPIIPEKGSVGASGDLLLAHMSLVLIGEGHARYKGEVLPAQDALKTSGIAASRIGSQRRPGFVKRYAGFYGICIKGPVPGRGTVCCDHRLRRVDRRGGLHRVVCRRAHPPGARSAVVKLMPHTVSAYLLGHDIALLATTMLIAGGRTLIHCVVSRKFWALVRP